MLRTNLAFLDLIERLYAESNETKNITLKVFPARYRFINQGENIRYIYIIKDGITKCFISEENGKDFIIEFLGKGEVVGELEAIKKINCLCNVEAISEVTAYVIPDFYFLKLIETNVEFTKILLQELSTRIIQTSSRASFQQLYTLEYGLIKLLKLQAEENIAISKEDMAAYLGISVRSFNRTLQQLKAKNNVDENLRKLLEKLG
ncbi:Crp/Fnr family transcriptional regulator [Pedobacter lithocola]|uniref:Crp/Fnr family transcriptional regulator n=1 Tax=Pedobacter lithocola TaxID=1908239 RepID=A0ABV8P4W8_9SPHI